MASAPTTVQPLAPAISLPKECNTTPGSRLFPDRSESKIMPSAPEPNPPFVFPARFTEGPPSIKLTSSYDQRPTSSHVQLRPPTNVAHAEISKRRSVGALPTFNFPASNSNLSETGMVNPPQSPVSHITLPSRSG